MTKFKFGLTVFLTLGLYVLFMVGAGNHFALYVDPLSFLAMVMVPYLIISFVYSPSEQLSLTGEILKQGESDEKRLREALAYLAALKRMIIVATGVTILLGIIGLLAFLGTMEQVGSNLAVALISTFYAFLYILAVVEPLRAAAEKKLING